MTTTTRTLAGDLVEADAQPAVSVKGVSESVAVHRLRKVRSAAESSTLVARTPFVGRSAEMAQFRGLLDACLENGYGQTVYVRGDPGIGKTRLVEQMAQLMQARPQGVQLQIGAQVKREPGADNQRQARNNKHLPFIQEHAPILASSLDQISLSE